MLKRLLTPLDGSPLAACALPHVVALALLNDADVHLLRVLEENGTSSHAVDPLDWHLRKTEARIYLEEVAAQLQKLTGRAPHIEVMEGPAATCIVGYAEQQAMDIIVLSSHGRSGMSPWNTSSVAQKVIQRAGCSVLLSRAYIASGCNHATFDPMRFRRVVVPLDGSQRAETILPVAVALVQQHEAELHLVHVVRRPELFERAPHTQEDDLLLKQVFERNRNSAVSYFEQIKARLPVEAQTHILVDFDVTSALLEFVTQNGADLVLATAHGYSAHTQMPYGAVATNFVLYGSTSILVLQDVPNKERTPDVVERLLANFDPQERTSTHIRTQPEVMY